MKWPAITRDGVLFVGGLMGMIYETVFHDGDTRSALIVVFAGMMGLPAFLRSDDIAHKKNGGSNGNGK
jgi:uncharacterized membrane protein YobD (UPF0266 family)